MDCIIDEIKEINKSYKRDVLDAIDIHKLLNKLEKHKCCKQCLLRKELKDL